MLRQAEKVDPQSGSDAQRVGRAAAAAGETPGKRREGIGRLVTEVTRPRFLCHEAAYHKARAHVSYVTSQPRRPRCEQKGSSMLYQGTLGASKGEFPCCWGDHRCAQRVVLALSRHPRCAQGEFPCCWGDARCEQKGRPMRAKGSSTPPTLMGKKIRPPCLRSKVKRAFASSDGFCIGLSHDCLQKFTDVETT